MTWLPDTYSTTTNFSLMWKALEQLAWFVFYVHVLCSLFWSKVGNESQRRWWDIWLHEHSCCLFLVSTVTFFVHRIALCVSHSSIYIYRYPQPGHYHPWSSHHYIIYNGTRFFRNLWQWIGFNRIATTDILFRQYTRCMSCLECFVLIYCSIVFWQLWCTGTTVYGSFR